MFLYLCIGKPGYLIRGRLPYYLNFLEYESSSRFQSVRLGSTTYLPINEANIACLLHASDKKGLFVIALTL